MIRPLKLFLFIGFISSSLRAEMVWNPESIKGAPKSTISTDSQRKWARQFLIQMPKAAPSSYALAKEEFLKMNFRESLELSRRALAEILNQNYWERSLELGKIISLELNSQQPLTKPTI